MTTNLQERIRHVNDRIAAACQRAGRSADEVGIIAVTKYVSLETTGTALDQGLDQIGENRWQDAAAKWEAFGSRAVWHFIGHLQTNKVKEVVGRFQYIHSLDRLSLAKEIEKKAAALGIVVPCFLQLNISGEESKYGMEPEALMDFVRELRRGCPHIRIEGLMTMAPYEARPEETRPVFSGLREWRDRLNAARLLDYEVHGLSMGMSNDFEIAIEEGATWVRLGTVLVGKE
ncbi:MULTISPECIES: YggS family pyridoxal phosphate-dependent enzyme [Paenibacillus]|uniref:YggS family pyridoxal phosphate-dependent enzyme n=1 Tax=Paenibacillus TaxID=44249 RepID=UPI0022B86E81|nr:YggS family pyridoxal phosphate-dependent enzyme [Paenibacillus caseinilyticus]MCZ8518787.1 YggS family pyridoxal phosphate-dependent enzyme [Paenibacillus caseinilyticus]